MGSKNIMQSSARKKFPPYHQHRARALKFFSEKAKQWNSVYEFRYVRISVRNQTTRWGSCSSRQILNFNYRLFFLPEHLADYVIVHELCHLAEMNHSRKFWQLVARTIPDYRKRHRELRHHQ